MKNCRRRLAIPRPTRTPHLTLTLLLSQGKVRNALQHAAVRAAELSLRLLSEEQEGLATTDFKPDVSAQSHF